MTAWPSGATPARCWPSGSSGRPSRRTRLAAALKYNKFVPAYLTGQKRIPIKLPPYYGIGDDAEAVHYAHRYLNQWRRTPGAVEWLAEHAKLRHQA